ncbi:DUF2061 domain-containing protein [Winogradskyella eckloniae]|uniref:DUF2061 domain-containing protein n=1 Tax=Winogradskyella eckloniae TaxID=1089306 RepID=UPI0015646491|nr:DUF2061 domain-containing protein [Winogradskyella eckloniae]NRD20793.1 DUF2061 domain-containing protein [Winogradskyella eckloniae]
MKFSKRHLAKTITWRLIGTLDTLLLSWFISSDLNVGMLMGVCELFTKMILYYIHERVWFKSTIRSSNKRHILKTFSWRGVGTIDTILLGWIITGNPMTGVKIGGAEVITKMLLYFGHEKLWYRINFGLDKRHKRKQLEKLNQQN